MKQKYQIQMGIGQFENAARHLGLKAIMPTPALSEEVYNFILTVRVRSYQPSMFGFHVKRTLHFYFS